MPDRKIGTVSIAKPLVYPRPGSTLADPITMLVSPGTYDVYLMDDMIVYRMWAVARDDSGAPVDGYSPIEISSKPIGASEFGGMIIDELRGRLDGYRTYSFVLDGFLRTVSCRECDMHTEVFTVTEEQPHPVFDEAWSLAREHASAGHGELRDALLKMDYGMIMRRFVSKPRRVSGYVVV